MFIMKIKILLFSIFLLLLPGVMISQSNEEKILSVNYKVKVDQSKFPADLGVDVKYRFENIFKVIPTLDFILLASKEESLFRVIPKMDSDFNRSYDAAISTVGGNNVYYHTRGNNIIHKDLFGEIVDIEIEQIYDWEILKVKKEILGYQCYKAVSNYKSIDKNGKEIIVDVIAWFTPEINISAGPLGFNNLPGLVLEASKNERYTFYATNLDFRIDEEIKKPEAKKVLSEKEFNIIVEEKLKQIRNGGF